MVCLVQVLKMKSIVIFLTMSYIFTCASGKSAQKRALVFPPAGLYGTFLAIAVPVDIPDRNVFVSYNFESNYSVIRNITEIDEVLFPNLPIVGSRHSRSITRELAYTVLENRFVENGMKARECMLRNICEAAETPLHHNGILGHLMHIVFTPSASREEGLDEEYYEAEAAGHRGDCDKFVEDCPTSLFDYITRLVEFPHSSLNAVHGYPGRACMLRAICDNADAHFLHNGLVGDLLYFILTPSTSMEEDDIEDCYYEAEYYGLDQQCERYHEECPSNPLERISLFAENVT